MFKLCIINFLFSVLDQKSKQSLQFFGGGAIGNFDGQLVVASETSVYWIRPVSVQLQIEVKPGY